MIVPERVFLSPAFPAKWLLRSNCSLLCVRHRQYWRWLSFLDSWNKTGLCTLRSENCPHTSWCHRKCQSKTILLATVPRNCLTCLICIPLKFSFWSWCAHFLCPYFSFPAFRLLHHLLGLLRFSAWYIILRGSGACHGSLPIKNCFRRVLFQYD